LGRYNGDIYTYSDFLRSGGFCSAVTNAPMFTGRVEKGSSQNVRWYYRVCRDSNPRYPDPSTIRQFENKKNRGLLRAEIALVVAQHPSSIAWNLIRKTTPVLLSYITPAVNPYICSILAQYVGSTYWLNTRPVLRGILRKKTPCCFLIYLKRPPQRTACTSHLVRYLH